MPTSSSQASLITDKEAREFVKRYNQKWPNRSPCEHGHAFCSTALHGPCYDEVLTVYPDLDPLRD